MSNSISASFAKYWSRRMQMKHEKRDVFRAIVSMEERAKLRNGDTVARPYRSAITVQKYVRGTAFTVQDLTDTEETLVVRTSPIAPFYVDDLDALQSNYNTTNLYADDAAVQLGNKIDADVLGEAVSAYSVVANYEMGGGGTAGDQIGFTVSTSNIQKVFAVADRKLNEQNIGPENRAVVMSPAFKQILLEYLAGKESALGDSTGQNGHIGKYFGFDLYVSNNLPYTYILEFGTNPTADDTVVVAGVTFTFKAAPSAAGEVDIGGTAAASLDNLVAAINNDNGYAASAGAATTYYEVTAANRLLLDKITAIDGGTYLELVSKGSSTTVSETLTAAADVWTTTKQCANILFLQKGAIDLVIQKEPNVEFKEVPDKLGRNIAPWTLYGKKTFREGTFKMVQVLTL